jgi:hypothetical protein
MAKEKADNDKQGWFARWRERRARSRQRASGISKRMYDEKLKPGPSAGAGAPQGGG